MPEDFNDYTERIVKAIKSVPGQSISLAKRQIRNFRLGREENIWLVESGHVMFMRGDSNGNFKGFFILGSGDFLGINIYGGITREVTAMPLNTVKMYGISSRAFEDLWKNDHSLCHSLFLYACSRLTRLMDDFEQTSFGSLEARLGALERRIQRLPNIGEPFRVSETIAGWAVGAHPVSVCRALKGRRIVFQYEPN